MTLGAVHLLLTYRCTYECDHCFVWGSPRQTETMTLRMVRRILKQARALETVTRIDFEGGEPFLCYPVLLEGARLAKAMGFTVGLVSNAYWATDSADAVLWLAPFKDIASCLSISGDLYHGDAVMTAQVRRATRAAEKLGIRSEVLTIAQPDAADAAQAVGTIPAGECGVMFKGRAAETLAGRVRPRPWDGFTECPHEDLAAPGRVHVDPAGFVHLCQGLAVGNVFRRPLKDIVEDFDPHADPVAGPLSSGGPAGLVKRYGLPHAAAYADACHLCYEARARLRSRFPDTLGPDPMYGVLDGAQAE